MSLNYSLLILYVTSGARAIIVAASFLFVRVPIIAKRDNHTDRMRADKLSDHRQSILHKHPPQRRSTLFPRDVLYPFCVRVLSQLRLSKVEEFEIFGQILARFLNSEARRAPPPAIVVLV